MVASGMAASMKVMWRRMSRRTARKLVSDKQCGRMQWMASQEKKDRTEVDFASRAVAQG
jgi:hypothetical protein